MDATLLKSLTKRAIMRYVGPSDAPTLRLSALGQCVRKLVLAIFFNDVEAIENDPTMGVKGAGKLWENFIASHVLPGWHQQVNVEYRGVKGHIDFCKVVTDNNSNNRELVIVECKTTYNVAPRWLPKQPHLLQLQAYMWGSIEGKIDLSEPFDNVRGILLYITREDPFIIHSYDVEPDTTAKQEIDTRIDEVKYYLRIGAIPPVPEGYSSNRFPCYIRARTFEYRCMYWHKCWWRVIEHG